jgi:hypothetical protein
MMGRDLMRLRDPPFGALPKTFGGTRSDQRDSAWRSTKCRRLAPVVRPKDEIAHRKNVQHMFPPMGQRNPTRRELLEHTFPVRLAVRVPQGQEHHIDRALRRVLGWQAHGRLGSTLYLTSLGHASGFVCACPDIQLDGTWPLRLTLAFEAKQEWLVRDALRQIVDDAGYEMERAGHHRGGAPAWHLGLHTVWDAVQFMRMAHPARLVAERHIGRNG